MENYYKNLPTKRIGAGTLIFNQNKELLILKPTYKEGWTVPGGVVEKDESLKSTLVREIREEIGIEMGVKDLLCVDYMSADGERDENIQVIFSAEILNPEEQNKIKIDNKEISEFRFVSIDEALSLLRPNLKRRLPKCLEALEKDTAFYLENGEKA